MRSKNCDTCGRPMEFSNFGRAPKACAACKSKLAERERLMHRSGKDLPRRAGDTEDKPDHVATPPPKAVERPGAPAEATTPRSPRPARAGEVPPVSAGAPLVLERARSWEAERVGLLRDADARRNSLLAELRELDRVIHSLRAPPAHPGGAPREFAVLPESSTGAVQLRGAPVAREG